MDEAQIAWTAYMRYRASLRGFELAKIEQIVRYSEERYVDNVTRRAVAVGRHDRQLVMIPYEVQDDTIIPVTVHVTTRRQIDSRLRSGRISHE